MEAKTITLRPRYKNIKRFLHFAVTSLYLSIFWLAFILSANTTLIYIYLTH